MTIQIKSVMFASVSLCLLWSLTIPLWHFPDEQAHFAQVQDYAEVKTVPKGNDLSLEIFESERVLGTLRDTQGRNKYTPTPGYLLPLSTTKWGYEEDYLKNLSHNTRETFVAKEAPRYAPFYYILGSFAYQQVTYTDLFTRVFVTRLVSILLFALLIFGGFLVSKEVFPENQQLQLAATGAIAFHPMLMFVSAGVNNDILMNTVSTFLIAKSLAVMRRRTTLTDLLHFGILVILGILSKQLIYLLFPMVGVALFISWFKYDRNWKLACLRRQAIGLLGICTVTVAVYFFVRQNNGGFWLPYWPTLKASPEQLFQAIIQVMTKLYRETLPWYWGVYKWLSLVLPLNLLRLIKVLMIVGVIGGIKGFIRTKNRRSLYWMLGLNFAYFTALILWESINLANNGFGHGLQGRYFFPLIATHMVMLVGGWWEIGGKNLGKWFPVTLLLAFCIFNLFSLWYVLGAYYHRLPLDRFVIELSQYKPDFAKWPNILIPIVASFVSIVSLMKHVVSQKGQSDAV